MPRTTAEPTLLGRKSRQILLAGVAGSCFLLASGAALVAAQNAGMADPLDAILSAQADEPCGAEDVLTEDTLSENERADAEGCAVENESAAEEIDLGGDRYSSRKEALSAEDARALSTLSDAEAQEIATLFDEEDSTDSTAEIGTTPSTEVAAQDDAPEDPANSDDTDMDLAAGETDMAAGPAKGDDAEATGTASAGAAEGADSGDDSSFDSAEAGSNSASPTGTIQGTGSLIALGVGEGLSKAINDPTSLDSLADIVVGTDPHQGQKDNVVQITALGGVTDGYLAVSALEALDGDTADPLGQLLAVDADNAPSGPSAPPTIDGVAEVNVGQDPDGPSFNVIQVDAFDENFMPDGSAGLANVAVGDGVDEGFGSLAGVSIGGQNNGEHDDVANVALGKSFDPLADPLSPLTGGVNDLGAAVGGGLAPILAPLAGALP